MQILKNIIEIAFEKKDFFLQHDKSKNRDSVVDAILEVLRLLDSGMLRVSENINGVWVTHQWLKKAIILSFSVLENKLTNWGDNYFFDKFSLKFSRWNPQNFINKNLRVVPPATVRYGAYIANDTVIMPSYINIGAYIDVGSMIDTWATVGSCAQIGKYVHLSGGVGIGGVLEPLQVNPTIIEDYCFIGARSEIAEGVIVEKGAVISMGVFIGQSTKIYDRDSGCVFYGRVPAGSVVIPGSFPDKNGKVNTYCAVIVKRVDSKTKNKIQINKLLRDCVDSD
ncbi:2,3,4,5-tetrahydropyridine-2,6-dicarboxylate N-succinyltransferase [Candidatus Blochmannia ocreatus (nom. nud.)]|uniref:2,3,4,5-tetrahydropyridine-2,6-dicarboxylate N-succinyltransferase n=1 Tax=Candidatus Blochmannia ocreatus (nom. nud.) TaxID=251538 RepID=A0ABY4SWG9_9ENTR|nr:2,3,4,5-tetrahydropyridine-2,6-dicarboxylate N-succinyltransferase [Candidatus Blochmannia ocreatus]URJ25335.1 2,3,4,5-tetrahydropyridine-2,6-dicarboxylate N-succinyltransferase [Candidatus Blochmannia ocreatus]